MLGMHTELPHPCFSLIQLLSPITSLSFSSLVGRVTLPCEAVFGWAQRLRGSANGHAQGPGEAPSQQRCVRLQPCGAFS